MKYINEAGRKDENGRTALMIAAMYGYEDIVRILAEKEAGMKDRNGYTALHYTAENSSTKECA